MQSGLVVTDDPVTNGGRSAEESPLDAFFRASAWNREDVELVLQTVQIGLLLYVTIKELTR